MNEVNSKEEGRKEKCAVAVVVVDIFVFFVFKTLK